MVVFLCQFLLSVLVSFPRRLCHQVVHISVDVLPAIKIKMSIFCVRESTLQKLIVLWTIFVMNIAKYL